MCGNALKCADVSKYYMGTRRWKFVVRWAVAIVILRGSGQIARLLLYAGSVVWFAKCHATILDHDATCHYISRAIVLK